MNGLEALKRIRQETAPNTYCKDFDKEECCNTIERELKDGEKYKKALEIINKKTYLDFISIREADNYDEYIEHFVECVQKLLKSGKVIEIAVSKDEFDLLKEVLK